MAEYADREHYIPLRRTDLIALLCREKDLPPPQREPFRQFCKLVTAVYHFEYQKMLDDLKDEYAPFDPDSVTRPIDMLTDEERDARLENFYGRFDWLMERANFKKLTRADLLAATEVSSDWGLNTDIDFSIFSHLEVFVRGEAVDTRWRRQWSRFWQREELKIPVFQRFAVILKQNKHRRLGPNPNTQSVFLKLFKDVPKADIEMLIPGGKLKMPKWAKGKLGASLITAVGFVAYKIFMDLAMLTSAIFNPLLNPLAFWGPLSLVGGYGYKQVHGYQLARQSYSFQLTRSLYYQTLDSNVGVLYHLMDEAEEQECREVILSYYYLWRYAGEQGWTAGSLDDYVEMDLERLVKLKIDFEIEDALDKLDRLQLAEKIGDRWRAVPLARALEVLDAKWAGYFRS